MPHKMTTIPYRISGIKTTQFALFPEKFVNGKDITVQTSFSFGYNEGLDSIRCISNFEYLQDENVLMISEIQCTFDISPDGTSELKQLKKVPIDFALYGHDSNRYGTWYHPCKIRRNFISWYNTPPDKCDGVNKK